MESGIYNQALQRSSGVAPNDPCLWNIDLAKGKTVRFANDTCVEVKLAGQSTWRALTRFSLTPHGCGVEGKGQEFMFQSSIKPTLFCWREIEVIDSHRNIWGTFIETNRFKLFFDTFMEDSVELRTFHKKTYIYMLLWCSLARELEGLNPALAETPVSEALADAIGAEGVFVGGFPRWTEPLKAAYLEQVTQDLISMKNENTNKGVSPLLTNLLEAGKSGPIT